MARYTPDSHKQRGENYTVTIIYIFYLIECILNYINGTCYMCITLCQRGHCMSYILSQMPSSDKIWECDGTWFHKSLILSISLRTAKPMLPHIEHKRGYLRIKPSFVRIIMVIHGASIQMSNRVVSSFASMKAIKCDHYLFASSFASIFI